MKLRIFYENLIIHLSRKNCLYLKQINLFKIPDDLIDLGKVLIGILEHFMLQLLFN